MRAQVWHGVWRLADPRISLASLASIFLGVCLAAVAGPIAWGWLALTVAGILAVETAKNASGEVIDFDSGADQAVTEENRSPFSGGKRVIVDGTLTRKETIAISIGFYALAVGVGVLLIALRDPRLFGLALIGVFLAYFYHAPPLRLAYRGFGECAVALTYGPLVCSGTYLVLCSPLTIDVLWLSSGVGLLIGAFLWINEFPDYDADRQSHKWTLVARLGKRQASRLYLGIVATAFAMLMLAPWVSDLPRTVWLGLTGVPFAGFAARRLMTTPEITARVIPAQAATLFAFLAYALGAGIGLLLG